MGNLSFELKLLPVPFLPKFLRLGFASSDTTSTNRNPSLSALDRVVARSCFVGSSAIPRYIFDEAYL